MNVEYEGVPVTEIIKDSLGLEGEVGMDTCLGENVEYIDLLDIFHKLGINSSALGIYINGDKFTCAGRELLTRMSDKLGYESPDEYLRSRGVIELNETLEENYSKDVSMIGQKELPLKLEGFKVRDLELMARYLPKSKK